jgi:hypothetical protein
MVHSGYVANQERKQLATQNRSIKSVNPNKWKPESVIAQEYFYKVNKNTHKDDQKTVLFRACNKTMVYSMKDSMLVHLKNLCYVDCGDHQSLLTHVSIYIKFIHTVLTIKNVLKLCNSLF